jgi:hypothetical protein
MAGRQEREDWRTLGMIEAETRWLQLEIQEIGDSARARVRWGELPLATSHVEHEARWALLAQKLDHLHDQGLALDARREHLIYDRSQEQEHTR